MRIIFDANVLLSAALRPRSIPNQAYRATELHEILASERVLEEMAEIFERPKFDRYLTPDERKNFLRDFRKACTVIEVSDRITACRDADDDKYLELAVSGGADCIVSGDQDLLALHPFRNIAILSPKGFLDWIASIDPAA